MVDGEIKFKISVEDTESQKAIKNIQQSAEKVDDSFKNVDKSAKKSTKSIAESFKKMGDVGSKMTKSVTLPIVGLGAMAVKSASDLNENINKTEVAFGSASQKVLEFSNTTLKQFGISKSAALDLASGFGDMGTAMGQDVNTAAQMSTGLVGLAGDLASFKNISVERAQTALTGIYTGETEALKGLGIVMTQANLQQFAINQGITTEIQNMSQAELVQLRYQYVMNATKNAQGDYNRTSDGTANLTRTATQNFSELSAQLGQYLLPLVNKLLSFLINVVDWFKNLDGVSKGIIVTLIGVVAAIGPLLTIISKAIGLFKMVKMAIAGVNAVLGFLSANPIVLVIAGITALVGVLIYCYNKFDWFRDGVNRVMKAIVNFVIGAINKVIGAINWYIKASLWPLNAMIKGLNKIPGVNIPQLSFSIPNIPQLRIGTDFVNEDGLAYLHKGEKVVPANVVKGGYSGNGNQPIFVKVEAKVREGVLFDAEQRINNVKGLQMQFGGGFSVSN